MAMKIGVENTGRRKLEGSSHVFILGLAASPCTRRLRCRMLTMRLDDAKEVAGSEGKADHQVIVK
jgi:hypothetical protein